MAFGLHLHHGLRVQDRMFDSDRREACAQVQDQGYAGGGSKAVISGGAALKAMLPKGRNVLVTIDHPGEPDMTAIAIFTR